MAAKDMDETLALLSKEAEVMQTHSTHSHELRPSKSVQINWGEFFTKIQNSDYKASAIEATAEYLVQVWSNDENFFNIFYSQISVCNFKLIHSCYL